MSNEIQIQQIMQLFERLLPLNQARRKDYLAGHSELPVHVVEQTNFLLESDAIKASLPSLGALVRNLANSSQR
jgi:hypothetical protein